MKAIRADVESSERGRRPIRVPRAAAFNLAFALFLSLSAAIIPPGASHALIWIVNFIFVIYLIQSVWHPVKLGSNKLTYIKFDALFLLFCFFIFFLPYVLDLVAGKEIGGGRHFPDNYYAEYVNTSLLSSLSAACAFVAGVQIGRRAELRVERQNYSGAGRILVAILACLTAIYVGSGWQVQAEGAYTGNVSGESVTAGGIYILVIVFTMACAAVIVFDTLVAQRFTLFTACAAALVFYWMSRALWFGDRNTFFLFALVIFAGIFSFKFKLSRTRLVLGVICALAIYNVAGVLRHYEDRSLGDIVTAASTLEGSGVDSFRNTTMTARAAYGIVPEHDNYFYGKSILLAFVGVVPYSRGFIVGDQPSSAVESSSLLTRHLLPPTARWGIGTNVVSDAYINLGYLGVVLILFFLGLGGATIEAAVRRNSRSLRWVVIYLAMLALYAELPRYAAAFPVRPLLWLFLFFWVYRIARAMTLRVTTRRH